MAEVLVTGGSIFGGILKRHLLAEGFSVTNIDIVPDHDQHPSLASVRGDIRDQELVRSIFASARFAAVFHCAAMLAHGHVGHRDLWTSNVDGTKNLAQACRDYSVRKLIFTSSNCLWGRNLGTRFSEQAAVSRRGLRQEHQAGCRTGAGGVHPGNGCHHPALSDNHRGSGSAGWVYLRSFSNLSTRASPCGWSGDGSNRYQFIYAQDLVSASELAAMESPARTSSTSVRITWIRCARRMRR